MDQVAMEQFGRSLPGKPATRETALDTLASAAVLLFEHGQTTERTIVAVERLGHAFGLPVRMLPHWGELVIETDRPPFATIVPAVPRGVDMTKVLAVLTVVDQVNDGSISTEDARPGLEAASRLPIVPTLRFALFAAIGAASLGVIFGALDAASLLLIAVSAGLGALARRGLERVGGHPFIEPLCAAGLAGLIFAIVSRSYLPDALSLIAFCPCMVLVPGPHILNGAIDLVRLRLTLGVMRLVYAGLIVLMICSGLLIGLAVGGASLPALGSSVSVPLVTDVLAAGCAVAAFGNFFSMPLRLLPLPIAVGMLAHASRWALVSMMGADVATGAFAACFVVGTIVTPIADRLRLPFAAVGFSAVVSLMPGFFLFRAASAVAQLVSIGPRSPPDLLAGIVVDGATAFLVILAMTFGLLLPHMLFERFLPASLVRDRRRGR
jgi:uncharacterized membrane protein YjjP (DUF1212 family)